MAATTSAMPVGQHLTRHAEELGDKTALIFAAEDGSEQEISWRQLEQRANQMARLLADHGLGHGDRIVVGLRNSPEHLYVTWAAWKLGATVIPLRWDLPSREREELLALAEPRLIVAAWEAAESNFIGFSPEEVGHYQSYDSDTLEQVKAPESILILGSGGSTGRPKLINLGVPGSLPSGALAQFFTGERYGDPSNLRLVGGPLYHAQPVAGAVSSIFEGARLVLLERFHAARTVDLVERHGVTSLFLAPIMMQRIAALPDVNERNFSTVQAVTHTGGPCPHWVKHTWFDLVGPENVYENYGMSERIGNTVIRGDEWLKHPGSVGRARDGAEIRILNEDGEELPVGEVGFIHFSGNVLRLPGNSNYIGADPPKPNEDGLLTVGDLGWLDDDGYLYIADRRTDMIVSGAANIFPAEVEAALSEHPDVDDVVVVGIPDAEWGRRVHAIIQPLNPQQPPDESELNVHVRERLARYKAPKSYEFIAQLPRNDAGKIRRSALAEERSALIKRS